MKQIRIEFLGIFFSTHIKRAVKKIHLKSDVSKKQLRKSGQAFINYIVIVISTPFTSFNINLFLTLVMKGKKGQGKVSKASKKIKEEKNNVFCY